MERYTIPSAKETKGCAHKYYAEHNTPEGKIKIKTGYETPNFQDPKFLHTELSEYRTTIKDFLGSIGFVPSKTNYDIIINGFKKGTIRVNSRRPMHTNLEKTIKDTEEYFMKINNLTTKDMNEDIFYEVTAYTQKGQIIKIPKNIYKPLTAHGNKSTITY